MALKEGDRAPDFELKSDSGDPVRLSDELQKHSYVLLAFFPAAFSSVCTNELNTFEEAIGELHGLGAGVLGISVDNFYSLREFKERNGLEFPLLSDFHPHGGVATQYGVLGDDGESDRVLLLIDREGTIRFVQAVPRKVSPGVDQVIDKLEELGGEGGQWRATGTG